MQTVPGGFESWGSALRTRRRRPAPLAILSSVILHGSLAAAAWYAALQHDNSPVYEQFRVKLYSPPPTVEGPPTPVEQTTTPVVTPSKPDPTPPQPQPKVEPKTQAALPKPVETKPVESKPATGKNAQQAPVGGEGLDVDIEGQEFPYPEYLQNIVLQLHRYFRGEGNLEVDVAFYIRRDGSAGGIRIVRNSGNFRFDLAAMEAVEQAGKAKAFGPLPKDFQGDRLLIKNTFAPNR